MNRPQQPPKPADYKSGVHPVWCKGCGDFGVLAAMTRAFAHLGLPKEQVAVVSGIGCSGRIPAYVAAYGFHGLHGRALPVATGLKLARPDLTVLAAGGDGDIYSIGAAHFVHTCRRNPDITLIVMDNRVYGMTKGQPSPTSEPDFAAALQPEGPGVPPVDGLLLALASRASFVARGFSGQPNELADIIVAGIEHPGFAVIEVLSPCPTFRPEQREWKRHVQAGLLQPAKTLEEAMAQVIAAPALSTGIVWREERAPAPMMPRPESVKELATMRARELAWIEKSFHP